MDYLKAFLVGGLICALVQILMEKTKMMPGRIMVLLVCSGAVLGALGLYGPFQEFAGAGASVPLLGFGNTLWDFQGRIYRQRGGNLRGPGVRISGQPSVPAENEKIVTKNSQKQA